MIVIIDSREPPDIVSLVKCKYPTSVVSQLVAGDLNIPLETGLLAIERKTPGDLLGSIADGRIFSQADTMVRSSRFPLVVVHGSLVYDHDDKALVDGQQTNWNGSSVRAALRAIQWAGCAVELVPSKDYLTAVEEAMRLASKEDHRHWPHNKTRKPPISFFPGEDRDRQAIEFIAGMPDVGPKRAEALLWWCGEEGVNGEGEVCHSLGGLATALDWVTSLPYLDKSARPEGWGMKSIEKVRSFLGLAEGEYLSIRRI